MSINLNHPDYIELRSRIREDSKDFVVIVGSGLSIPCGLPSWEKLKDLMVEDAVNRTSDLPEEEIEGYLLIFPRIDGHT